MKPLLTLWPLLLFMSCTMPASRPVPDAAVDALFQSYDHPDVPGAAVLVVQNGKVLYKKTFGLADLEERTPSTPATNYRLASLTKAFTAMATMMLAERGAFSYDTPLPDFFPDFPAYGNEITVRHLLSHTSGLPDYEDLIPDTTTVPLRDRQVLDLLLKTEAPLFPPGSQYRYSNSGYALLALMVEKGSGQSFAQFLKTNLFEPLGMMGTVAFENGISTVAQRAYGYRQRGDSFERRDQSLTSSVLGDGGIYSSLDDLYKWDQALYTSELVRAETLRQAFTPATATDEPGVSYGYGWFIETYRGHRTVWHYGSTIGFGTAIERFPDLGLTVVVLVNRNGTDGHALARQVVDLYLPAGG